MSRPQCSLCKGQGVRNVMSFSVAGAERKTTCNACKGKGTLAVTVDVYDIIDHLESMGSTKEAISVERCFGISPPSRDVPKKGNG